MQGAVDAPGFVMNSKAVEYTRYFAGIVGKVFCCHSDLQWLDAVFTQQFLAKLLSLFGGGFIVFQYGIAFFDLYITFGGGRADNGTGDLPDQAVGFFTPLFVHGPEGAFYINLIRYDIGSTVGNDFSKGKHGWYGGR